MVFVAKPFIPRLGDCFASVCMHPTPGWSMGAGKPRDGRKQGLGMALTFSPFSNRTVPSALQLLGTSL